MSRGYGRLQVSLLVTLHEHERTASRHDRLSGLDTLELARRLQGHAHRKREPTRSKLVSVRRALAALMRDGKVSHIGTRYEHRHHWVRVVR